MSAELEAGSWKLEAEQSVQRGRHPISAELSNRPVLLAAIGIPADSAFNVQLLASSFQLATGLQL